MVRKGKAQIAMREVADVAPQLDRHRLIEAVVMTYLLDVSRRCRKIPHQRLGRIAGSEMNDQKIEDCDCDDRRDSPGKPHQEVVSHALASHNLILWSQEQRR